MLVILNRWSLFGALVGLIVFSSPSFAQDQDHRLTDREVAMTRGNFQLGTGDFQAAIESFKKALSVKPNDKEATLALGVAYARAGDNQHAKQALQQAHAIDPADMRTRYELGVVLYRLGEKKEAKDHFSVVVSGSADEGLKAAAEQYLRLLASGAAKRKGPFSLTLAGGFQHDSNVILEPDNPITPTQGKTADWRAIVTLDGVYTAQVADKTALEAGYQFYQSMHNTLTTFNVQQHNVMLGVKQDLSDNTTLGLRNIASYSLVDRYHYSQTDKVAVLASTSFVPETRTELTYAFEVKKYYDSDAFKQNSQRDSKNNALGISQTLPLGRASTLTIGYDFDADSADTTGFWSYIGNRGHVQVLSAWRPYTLSVEASYYDRKYGALIPGFLEKRHDGEQNYSISLSRDFSKSLSLALSGLHVVNDSNIDLYKYSRDIISVFLVKRL